MKFEDMINTITLGDSYKLIKDIPNNSIDLIVTDPPYKITSRGSSGTMGGYWKTDKAKKGTIFNNNNISCKEYLPEFYRILKDKTICYVMCNNTNLQEMINVGIKSGFHFVKCLIWQKDNIVGVTNDKAIGILYIDDRGFRYNKENSTTENIKEIKELLGKEIKEND